MPVAMVSSSLMENFPRTGDYVVERDGQKVIVRRAGAHFKEREVFDSSERAEAYARKTALIGANAAFRKTDSSFERL
jgi:hypothetical protein